MTLSLVAVFIPVLFMGGIIGRLFNEFAVTIAAAILFSGFVSLTLTPMLASRFVRAPQDVRHGRLYTVTEGWFFGPAQRVRQGAFVVPVAQEGHPCRIDGGPHTHRLPVC